MIAINAAAVQNLFTAWAYLHVGPTESFGVPTHWQNTTRPHCHPPPGRLLAASDCCSDSRLRPWSICCRLAGSVVAMTVFVRLPSGLLPPYFYCFPSAVVIIEFAAASAIHHWLILLQLRRCSKPGSAAHCLDCSCTFAFEMGFIDCFCVHRDCCKRLYSSWFAACSRCLHLRHLSLPVSYLYRCHQN